MIPPPAGDGASSKRLQGLLDDRRHLGTAEAGVSTCSLLNAGLRPASWRGSQQVVG